MRQGQKSLGTTLLATGFRIGWQLLITTLLFFGWAWINIQLLVTSPATDVIFAGCVILWLISQASWVDKSIRSLRRGPVHIIAWMILVFTLLAGLAWATQYFMTYEISQLMRNVLFPITAADEMIARLRDQIAERNQAVTTTELSSLLWILIPLGIFAIVVASLVRLVWLGILPRVALTLVQLRLSLPTTPFRPHRVVRLLQRGGLVIACSLVFLVWVVGRADYTAIDMSWQQASVGPLLPVAVYDLAIDPTRGLLFASTAEGVFLSKDGSESWQPMNQSEGFTPVWSSIRHLTIDSHNGMLYAVNNSREEIQLIRISIESDESKWDVIFSQPTQSFINASFINALELIENTSKHLHSLIGVSDNLFISSDDQGESWSRSTQSLEVRDITVAPGGEVYGIDWQGQILQLDVDGTNWIIKGRTGIVGQAKLFADRQPGHLFIISWNGRIFQSTDAGQSWDRVTIRDTSGTADLLAHGKADTDRVPELEVLTFLSDQAGDLYVGTNAGVFRSTDHSRSWLPASTGLKSPRVRTLIEDPRDGSLYAGTDAGIFRSRDNADSWQLASIGLFGNTSNGLALDVWNDSLLVFPYESQPWYVKYQQPLLPWVDAQLPTALTKNGFGYRLSMGRSDFGINTIAMPATTTQLQIINDQILLAKNGSLAFLSEDNGVTWKRLDPGETVYDWVVDRRSIAIFALGRSTLYRSIDRGSTWQTLRIDPDHADVDRDQSVTGPGLAYSIPQGAFRDFIVDDNDRAYYVITAAGLERSTDEGKTWDFRGPMPPDSSNCTLFDDSSRGLLYTVCWIKEGSYLFRSNDQGTTWISLLKLETLAGPRTTEVDTWRIMPTPRSIDIMPWSGSLFVDLDSQYFRSDDSGETWNPAFTTLRIEDISRISFNEGRISFNEDRISFNEERQALYINTPEGIYRSLDDGAHWESVSANPNSSVIHAVTYSQTGKALYIAMSDSSLYRSNDNGASWEALGIGVPATTVYALAIDPRDESIYAGTSNGLLHSMDEGASWYDRSGDNLQAMDVTAIVIDPDRDEVFVRAGFQYEGIYQHLYRGSIGSTEWQAVSPLDLIANLPQLIFSGRYEGLAVQPEQSEPIWLPLSGAQFWLYFFPSSMVGTSTLAQFDDDAAQLIIPYQNMLITSPMPIDARRTPLGVLLLRACYWYASTWIAASAPWLITVGSLSLVVAGIRLYFAQVRPFRIPFWAPVLGWRRIARYVRPEIIARDFPNWARIIREQLVTYGDVRPSDLVQVPTLLRSIALRHFAEQFAGDLAIVTEGDTLRLLSRTQVQVWHRTWNAVGQLLDATTDLGVGTVSFIDQLAETVAEALGFTIISRNKFEQVCVYQVEAPALRLNVPPRFPMIFLADSHPDARTVQMLVDAVDVIKESSFFALVVPLEPLHPTVDIPARLHQSIEQSTYVHDFIVLPRDRLLGVLMARRPIKLLTDAILAQVDLSVVSPFVISGPVRETMFFGREAEVKLLVENVSRSDFAIVGNRRIGKTSLLSRVRSRLIASGQVRLLSIDCQYVRDDDSFFKAFEAQTGIELAESTPMGFAAALTSLSANGLPIVLMIDEVDALLNYEQTTGEALVAIWRSLAQNSHCHFIFCGSTTLARRLTDARSAFFNFAQKISLCYLEPGTAKLLLFQPLETLGIEVDDVERLGDELLSLTSGHPNLIQYVGKTLIDRVNQRGERRIATTDISDLHESATFADYLLRVTWGEAGPLEKLITLTAPAEQFRLNELEMALERVGITVGDEAIDAALEILQVYSVLEKRGRAYQFVPKSFRTFLHQSQEVERLITQEKRRLVAGGTA